MQRRTWIVGVVAVLFVLVAAALVFPLFSSLDLGASAWAAEGWQQGPPEDQPEDVRKPEGARQNLSRFGVRGTVTAASSGEVLVETEEGERVILLVSDDTRYWAPGEPVTTTMDLSVGDPLLAFGKPASAAEETDERALEARLLVVVSDEELPNALIRGRVVAVTRQTLVVQTGRGERAITVLPRTHILSPVGRLDSLRGIRRGDLVIALGQPTEMGQWMAGLVLVSGPGGPVRPVLRGEVRNLDLGAGTLTVETRQGDEIVVFTSTDTRYRIPEVTDPELADIQVGDRIDAAGRFDKEDRTRFEARGVRVLPPVSKDEQP